MAIAYLNHGSIALPNVNLVQYGRVVIGDTRRTARGTLRRDVADGLRTWRLSMVYLTNAEYRSIMNHLDGRKFTATTFWLDEFGGVPAANSISAIIDVENDERVAFRESGDWNDDGHNLTLLIQEGKGESSMFELVGPIGRYQWASTDTPPTDGIPTGSIGFETDTSTHYRFDGEQWVEEKQVVTGIADIKNWVDGTDTVSAPRFTLNGSLPIIWGATLDDRPAASSVEVGQIFALANANLDMWISNGISWEAVE